MWDEVVCGCAYGSVCVYVHVDVHIDGSVCVDVHIDVHVDGSVYVDVHVDGCVDGCSIDVVYWLCMINSALLVGPMF